MNEDLQLLVNNLKFKGQPVTQYTNLSEGLYILRWANQINAVYVAATLAGNIIVEGPPQWRKLKVYDLGNLQNQQYPFIWGPFFSREHAHFIEEKLKQQVVGKQ